MSKKETEPATALAERLREVRHSFGNPERKEFAKTLGIAANSLGNYERGESVPGGAVLQKYREVFDIDINWLLTGKGFEYDVELSNALRKSYVKVVTNMLLDVAMNFDLQMDSENIWQLTASLYKTLENQFDGNEVSEQELRGALEPSIEMIKSMAKPRLKMSY